MTDRDPSPPCPQDPSGKHCRHRTQPYPKAGFMEYGAQYVCCWCGHLVWINHGMFAPLEQPRD